MVLIYTESSSILFYKPFGKLRYKDIPSFSVNEAIKEIDFIYLPVKDIKVLIKEFFIEENHYN